MMHKTVHFVYTSEEEIIYIARYIAASIISEYEAHKDCSVIKLSTPITAMLMGVPWNEIKEEMAKFGIISDMGIWKYKGKMVHLF